MEEASLYSVSTMFSISINLHASLVFICSFVSRTFYHLEFHHFFDKFCYALKAIMKRRPHFVQVSAYYSSFPLKLFGALLGISLFSSFSFCAGWSVLSRD